MFSTECALIAAHPPLQTTATLDHTQTPMDSREEESRQTSISIPRPPIPIAPTPDGVVDVDEWQDIDFNQIDVDEPCQDEDTVTHTPLKPDYPLFLDLNPETAHEDSNKKSAANPEDTYFDPSSRNEAKLETALDHLMQTSAAANSNMLPPSLCPAGDIKQLDPLQLLKQESQKEDEIDRNRPIAEHFRILLRDRTLGSEAKGLFELCLEWQAQGYDQAMVMPCPTKACRTLYKMVTGRAYRQCSKCYGWIQEYRSTRHKQCDQQSNDIYYYPQYRDKHICLVCGKCCRHK